MTSKLAWTVVAFLSLSISSAHSQQRTMAIYGDWTLSCTISSAGKSCGLVQVQQIKGQSTAVSQVGIGRNAKTDPLKISIEVSSSTWIPSGVKLIASDNAPAITAPFKWCTSTRCLADADLSDANIKTLRTQKDPGKLLYMTASQANIAIPVSFSGFSDALDALQNQ
jgi:invasion protein IalB